MLLPAYPLQFRKRAGRRKPKATASPVPPVGLTIVSVAISPASEYQLIVTFGGSIVWNGVDVPAEFKAFTSDGWLDSCINVLNVGADWIEVEFNGSVEPGAAWEVNGAMAGISPAIAFPQSGVVS